MKDPWMALGVTAAALAAAWLWFQDLRAWRRGRANPKAFPGATGCSARLIVVGVLVAIALVALETWAEFWTGVSAEQSRVALPLLVYSVLGAPFIEELLFRGYLTWEGKGKSRAWLWAVLWSVVFTLIHGYLVSWGEGGLVWVGGLKGWVSSAFLFLGSIWFYALRLHPANEHRSLLPSWAAHTAKNVAVMTIKAAYGYIG